MSSFVGRIREEKRFEESKIRRLMMRLDASINRKSKTLQATD